MNASMKVMTPEQKWHAGRQADAFFGLLDHYNQLLLLICAAYQNQAGQGFHALRTTQQALALSRKHNLAKEIIWSLWGICAILIQQGDFEQAAMHLVDLQAP